MPRLTLYLENRRLLAAVDAGASLNLIDRSFISHDKQLNTRARVSLKLAVNNEPIFTAGTVQIACTIEDVKHRLEFHVVENLGEDVLLGRPFLSQERAIIDFGRRCIHLGLEKRQTILWPDEPQPRHRSPASLTPADVHHEFPQHLLPTFQTILNDFSDTLNLDPRPSTTLTTAHRIRLKDHTPFRLKPYRTTAEKQTYIEEQVQQMLRDGIIERSHSEYASPIVVVQRNSKPRFCIDYRRINSIMVDEPTPIPRIPETLKDLNDSVIFSSLDLKSGYWQIPMEPESRKYTAFSTMDGGVYNFKVMPFGLKSAPTTFQRMMSQEVLTGYLHKFCMVYLDDIVIYSKTYLEHLEHLRLVLERLQNHTLTCNPEKCRFAVNSLEYLGHVVGAQGNSAQPKHLLNVQESAAPKTKRQLQSFLGTCNWLREYIPHFAEIAAPLTDLLSTKKKFTWGTTQENAFHSLKDALATPHTLSRPDPSLPFILQTDASSIGMAAVLFQEVPESNEKRIISYASAKFNQTEKRLHINEQECLAVVWGIKMYRPYLEDRHFTVRTDSRALLWLHKSKDAKAKLTRWSLLLQEYSFSVQHVSGTSNQLADTLSRDPDLTPHNFDIHDLERLFLPEPPPPSLPEETAFLAEVVTLADEVRECQTNSPSTQQLIRNRNELENRADFEDWHAGFRAMYEVREGILYHKRLDGKRVLYVPGGMHPRILFEHHDAALAGHPGEDETLRSIQDHFHWPTIKKTVRQHVRTCLLCARVKGRASRNHAEQRPRQPRQPFESVACDLMGPYDPTPEGYRFIFVVTDLFTRWVDAWPLQETSTKTLIDVMDREFFPLHGYVREIISDNGPQFTSALWLRACARWQGHSWTTAVYHPRANPTERRNQEIKKGIRLRLDGRPASEWATTLPATLFSIRRRRNAATGQSPAELLTGKNLSFPGEWETAEPLRRPAPDRQDDAREHQRLYIEKTHIVPEHPAPDLQPGDLVLVRHPPAPGAFHPKWIGPHAVVRKIENYIFLINIDDRHVRYHVDKLRRAPRRPRRPQN